MPIIHAHKNNSLTKMMRENFYGNDIVLKLTLEAGLYGFQSKYQWRRRYTI